MTISREDVDKTSATWYAWGRNDAEGTRTDVFAFAEFYVAQRHSRGQSVQDAYTTFVAQHVAPEVREACAEYDPERDDFEDEVDTPADYEGDRYTVGSFVDALVAGGSTNIVCDDFVPATGDPGHCARCGQYDSDHFVDEDAQRGDR